MAKRKLPNMQNGESMMAKEPKEVRIKLVKGLLDLIVLHLLDTQPMHGYQIIKRIRKDFEVYFGPSNIYPLLNTLEKKGYVKSEWDMLNDRPRRVCRLTTEGRGLLNVTEYSLNSICSKIGTTGITTGMLVEEDAPRPA